KLVRHSEKEEFYRRMCSSVRTARDYITLAKHHELVEAFRRRVADLSFRRALVMIREAMGTKGSRGAGSGTGNPSPPPPKSLHGWTDDEIKQALLALEFDRFNRVIPAPYRARLKERASAQIVRLAQAQPSKTKLKD